MRNLKKFLALVLATMMLLSVAVISTNAAETNEDYVEAANRLASLQVMKGNENGDLMLENGVTRYQAALFFVQALTGETDVAVWNADKKSASFSDVPEYGTAIDYANGIGIVKGLGNGTFGYNNAITYQDMLVMAVRALGYETEDMSYPYGYILAAQKLGLTEKVDLVNYKAALTRGETACIIWEMLNTQVAVVDPLTDKVYYPQETPAADNKFYTQPTIGAPIERKDLLVDSGLAGDLITGVTITGFVKADEATETPATVTVTGLAAGFTSLKAADLGITEETPLVSYVGLGVNLYVDVDDTNFTDINYNDGKANIVFATFPEYTTVQNLGDDGDVKYVADTTTPANSYISFAGEKFKTSEYNFVVKTFANGAWSTTGNTATLTNIFAYDANATTTPRYTNTSANTYGEVAYRVTAEHTTGVTGTVEVLYTPFEFGQYNVREINGVKYTVVAVYDPTATTYTNAADEDTMFVEYLVDRIGRSNGIVDDATTSITTTKGKAASTVTVEGVAVEAGDFMFYNYNAADNILTVVENCGTFQTGKLNGKNNKNAVKINGQFVDFGFSGNYPNNMEDAFNNTVYTNCIAAIDANKDNVKYLVVDGKIVHFEVTAANNAQNLYPYAIVTTDAAIMAELLDLQLYVAGTTTVDNNGEYMSALTGNSYVEDGVVKVAMLNLTTGGWELASIGGYATNYNAADDKFNKTWDIATEVENNDLITNYKNSGVVSTFEGLVDMDIVAVVDVKDGVYTVAAEETGFFEFNNASATALTFSDTSTKTNAITATPDADNPTAARVTLDNETVVVVVTDTEIGYRVGTQKAANSINTVVGGRFLSANADLIVLDATSVVFANPAFSVADWTDDARADSENAWYLTTVDTTVEVEAGATTDDPYTITILNLYDMKAQKVIESISYEDTVATTTTYTPGTVLKVDNKGDLYNLGALTAQVVADVTEAVDGELDFFVAPDLAINGDDTVVITGVEDGSNAVTIKGTVVTINNVVDAADYDFSKAVLDTPYASSFNTNYKVGDAEIKFTGRSYTDDNSQVVNNMFVGVEYALELDEVETFDKAVAGVIDNYVIDTQTQNILVPAVNDDDYANGITVTVTLYVAYSYDATESDVMNLVIYKVIG